MELQRGELVVIIFMQSIRINERSNIRVTSPGTQNPGSILKYVFLVGRWRVVRRGGSAVEAGQCRGRVRVRGASPLPAVPGGICAREALSIPSITGQGLISICAYVQPHRATYSHIWKGYSHMAQLPHCGNLYWIVKYFPILLPLKNLHFKNRCFKRHFLVF